ncbi:MAG: hypothetical protein AB7K09_20920 [Planctomycetota bacterium]
MNLLDRDLRPGLARARQRLQPAVTRPGWRGGVIGLRLFAAAQVPVLIALLAYVISRGNAEVAIWPLALAGLLAATGATAVAAVAELGGGARLLAALTALIWCGAMMLPIHAGYSITIRSLGGLWGLTGSLLWIALLGLVVRRVEPARSGRLRREYRSMLHAFVALAVVAGITVLQAVMLQPGRLGSGFLQTWDGWEGYLIEGSIVGVIGLLASGWQLALAVWVVGVLRAAPSPSAASISVTMVDRDGPPAPPPA